MPDKAKTACFLYSNATLKFTNPPNSPDRKTVPIDTRPTEPSLHLAFDGRRNRYRDAQRVCTRARADTCKRTRPRSCTKPRRDGIATMPTNPCTNHPKRGNQADYMRERGSMRACRREFSERIAGLEARLGVATNEHESSLDARGHLRRTPSGKLAR